MMLNNLQRLDARGTLVRILREMAFDFLSFYVCQHKLCSNYRTMKLQDYEINSPIHICHHKINAAQDRDQIWDQQPAADLRDRLHVGKGRCADAGAIRLSISITDQVIAVNALGRFDADTCLTGRDDGPPTHVQEMIDQGFNVIHRPFLEWWCGQWVVGFIRSGWHVLQTLFDDAQALTHLCDSHHTAVVGIAVRGSGDIEFKIFVTRIRSLLAEVPLKATSAQIWPSYPPFNGLL